jgi:hypothetical protein
MSVISLSATGSLKAHPCRVRSVSRIFDCEGWNLLGDPFQVTSTGSRMLRLFMAGSENNLSRAIYYPTEWFSNYAVYVSAVTPFSHHAASTFLQAGFFVRTRNQDGNSVSGVV